MAFSTPSKVFSRYKDLTNYFIASILTMAVSLVLNPFVAINMSKGDFAITGYYTSFNLLILPLVGFSLLQYYSKSYFRVDVQEREKLLNTITCSTILFGFVSLVLICIGYYFIHQARHIDLPYFPYAILFFSAVFMGIFLSTYLTKLKFEKNSKRFLRVSIFNAAVHAVCIILLVIALKMRAFGYALATACTPAITGIFSLRYILTKIEIDRNMLRQALAFSWPLIFANIMEYVYVGIDRSFLVGLNDIQQLGLYNVAVTIGSYVTVFYTTIAQTFQPDLFEAVSKRDRSLTTRIVIKIQLMNFVPILFFIIFAPYLIDILTFGRYVECTGYARIIALKGIFAAFYFSLSSIIIASGLSKISLIIKIMGTTLTYFLFDYLIGHYDFYGAAWGQALSYASLIVITYAFICYNRKKIFA